MALQLSPPRLVLVLTQDQNIESVMLQRKRPKKVKNEQEQTAMIYEYTCVLVSSLHSISNQAINQSTHRRWLDPGSASTMSIMPMADTCHVHGEHQIGRPQLSPPTVLLPELPYSPTDVHCFLLHNCRSPMCLSQNSEDTVLNKLSAELMTV